VIPAGGSPPAAPRVLFARHRRAVRTEAPVV